MALIACGEGGNATECKNSSDCNLQEDGLCMSNPSTGSDWCTYPDSTCPSGRRWSDFATGDGLSGLCVDTGVDASVVDASVLDAPPVDAPIGDAANFPDAFEPDAGQPTVAFLAVGNNHFSGRVDRVYRVDSPTMLTLDFTTTETDATRANGWADIDSDGDLDFAVATGGGAALTPARVYRNDGAGAYPIIWNATESDQNGGLDFGDYDLDGDPDLVVSNFQTNDVARVYRNSNGLLTLQWTAPSSETDGMQGIQWADYNRDGKLDFAVTSAESTTSKVYVFAQDNGSWQRVWGSTETGSATNVAWGDYDKDGDPDLLVLSPGATTLGVILYRNDLSTFTNVWSLDGAGWNDAAWADYDSDGDVDFVLGRDGGNRLYRNDGAGTFTLVWTSTETDNSRSVAWGDYDFDGDPDLAVGNYSQPVRVYQNDSGTMTLAWSSTLSELTSAVSWGIW